MADGIGAPVENKRAMVAAEQENKGFCGSSAVIPSGDHTAAWAAGSNGPYGELKEKND
jgi:hypothetical protein